MDLGFMGGAYAGTAREINAQRTVNYDVYVDDSEQNVFLKSTAGLREVYTLPQGPVRATYEYKGELYAVGGNTFYRVPEDGSTPVVAGTLLTSEGRVAIQDNGLEMLLADNPNAYVSDGTNLVQVVDPEFVSAATLAYIDGYFIMNRPGTGTFATSDLRDGASYIGTDFAEAEGWPDDLLAVFADRRELWAFGEKTTEVYYNSSNTDFPFERFQGGFINEGIAAAHSVARVDRSLMWLSNNERGGRQIVRVGEGYSRDVVSTDQIAYQIAQYERVDDAFAFSYVMEGHEYYQITFPTADATWVYDASVPPQFAWTKRSSDLGTGNEKRHLANTHCWVYGKHLVGSYVDGAIYELDPTIGTDANDPVIRTRVGKHVNDNERSISLPGAQLVIAQGDGGITSLRWSKDRGNTWGNFIPRVIPSLGDKRQRLVWNKLGVSSDWLFESRTVSDNPVVLRQLAVPDGRLK